MTGQVSYHAGLAAEDIVARHYEMRGVKERARRWRGPGGEIDLILERGNEIIFVEVKKSKTFAKAADRVTSQQLQRISASANGYLATLKHGLSSAARIDVALVDSTGAVEILENVTLH
ncbi:MAG: YraN family protein [Pseudomonadota bacterium]